MKLHPMLALPFVLAAGCSATSAVVKQASFDLNCPAEKLQVTEMNSNPLGGSNYGVTGCDKRASYFAGCGFSGCAAIQNTTSAVQKAESGK